MKILEGINQNPAVLGAILMTGAAASFAVMTILIREATADMHALEVTFWRNALALVALAPWILKSGPSILRTSRPGLMLVRGVVGWTGMVCIFSAISLAPVADVAALNFTVPLFVTALAPFIVGEKVGIRRWSATLVGFLGAMVVLRPGLIEISTGGMLALIAAAFMACALSMVKVLARTDSPNTILVCTALVMTPLSAVPAAFVWTGPQSLTMFAMLFAIAALGTFAQHLMTRSFKIADQSYVFVFDFLRLPFVAVLAYLAFGETVDVWTWVGAVIIFSAAAYTAQREARLKKA